MRGLIPEKSFLEETDTPPPQRPLRPAQGRREEEDEDLHPTAFILLFFHLILAVLIITPKVSMDRVIQCAKQEGFCMDGRGYHPPITTELQKHSISSRKIVRFARLRLGSEIVESEEEFEQAKANLLLDEYGEDDPDQLLGKLQIAEDYLHLTEVPKAMQATDDVIRVALHSKFAYSDVSTFAQATLKNSMHIRAIILFQVARDLFEMTVAPSREQVVRHISSSSWQICRVIEMMVEAGAAGAEIFIDYAVELVIDTYDRIGVFPRVDPNNKSLQRAWLSVCIGYGLRGAERDDKAIGYIKSAVTDLERQFGSSASKYQIYGHLLEELGSFYILQRNLEEAENILLKAVEARKEAADYNDESERLEDLSTSRAWLKASRE